MMWTDDPIMDAANYDADADEYIKSLPTCDECGEHIQGEGYYEVNENKICPDCMRDHWRWIEV